MQTTATNKTLAHQIGLCRIALVVNRFYSMVEVDAQLATPFRSVKDWQEHRARMTYFWWETLGGYTRNRESFNGLRSEAAARFSPELLNAWMNLFHSVVYSVVEPQLAKEWMETAGRVGQTVRVAAERREHVSGAQALSFAS